MAGRSGERDTQGGLRTVPVACTNPRCEQYGVEWSTKYLTFVVCSECGAWCRGVEEANE